MSVTLTIDEALLREAERATGIHDWPTLVKQGLQALTRQPRSQLAKANAIGAASPPTLEGHSAKGWTDEDFDRTLAAAAHLPDLTDAEFDAFLAEMNRPLPPAWTE